MAVENAPLLAFNRGIVSPLALARVDIKRIALSAQIQENFMPRVLGSMSLRQGLQYVLNTLNNQPTRYLPFLFASDDTALIELTDSSMRIVLRTSSLGVFYESVISRVSVTSAVTNGTFVGSLAGWADSSEAGGTVTWVSNGNVSFQGDGVNAARLTQLVAVAGANIGKEHALRIQVAQGDEVHLRVGNGSTYYDETYVKDMVLLPGTHSVAFTPVANFYIVFSTRANYVSLLNSCVVEGPGDMVLPTVWGASDLNAVRVDASADVTFVACSGRVPQRIERHGMRSWSVVEYIAEDGPFGNVNTTPTTLTPSALSGSCTVTASKPMFSANFIDRLVAISSIGQNAAAALGALNAVTGPILVTGLTAQRAFGVVITGTFNGTVMLEQSIGAIGSWTTVTSWTTPVSTSYNDALDNQIIYYRLRMSVYVSGTANVALSYAAGSLTGYARFTGYVSTTVMNATITQAFGAVTASPTWKLGEWSIDSGYPSAVALHQQRSIWAGKGKLWGSISGSFVSHNPAQVGDAGPLNYNIGSGLVDIVRWLAKGAHFLIGAQGSEFVVRSDALDAPLTPTSTNVKEATTFGSAGVAPLHIDQNLLFVAKTGSRVYEISADAYTNAYSLYNAQDLTVLAPEVCKPYIVRCAVARNPDTRAHFVLSDGTVAVLVFDKAEDVKAWIKFTTMGLVEDVVVMPAGISQAEDDVYYVVKRTIGGGTVRFLEKFSLESETTGTPVARLADAHTSYAGAATTTISGLSYLNGQTVVCWGWNTVTPFTATKPDGTVATVGKDFGTFVVSGGAITLPQAVTNACVGLAYQAKFESTKLAYASQKGTALNQKKQVKHLGLVLNNTHAQGLQYGSDFTHLDVMPQIEAGGPVDSSLVWDSYDFDAVEFNDTFTTDSRLCLVANAPRPCTVLAAVVSVETNEKT